MKSWRKTSSESGTKGRKTQGERQERENDRSICIKEQTLDFPAQELSREQSIHASQHPLLENSTPT